MSDLVWTLSPGETAKWKAPAVDDLVWTLGDGEESAAWKPYVSADLPVTFGTELIAITVGGVRWQDGATAVLDGIAFTGRLDCLVTTLPALVGAAGEVAKQPFCEYTMPDSADTFTAFQHILVTNLDGTQTMDVELTQTTNVGDVDMIVGWGAATVAHQTGADLDWNSSTQKITSTAGGVFVVSLIAGGAWS